MTVTFAHWLSWSREENLAQAEISVTNIIVFVLVPASFFSDTHQGESYIMDVNQPGLDGNFIIIMKATTVSIRAVYTITGFSKGEEGIFCYRQLAN